MIGVICPLAGAGEIAVDQVRLQVGLDERHDDDDLIDVGDEDMLPAARGARQNAVPRLDAFDEAFVVERRPNPDVIAGRDDVAFVGRQRLEQAPYFGANLSAVVHLHDAVEPMDAQHAALDGMPLRSTLGKPPSSTWIVRLRDRSPLERMRSPATVASSAKPCF